jgi:hypothetical protein
LIIWKHGIEEPFIDHLESWFSVNSLISVLEDNGMYQEAARLLPSIRNVILVSLNEEQKTYGSEGPFIDQLRELMSGIQPPLQAESSQYLVHIVVILAPLHILPHPLLHADSSILYNEPEHSRKVPNLRPWTHFILSVHPQPVPGFHLLLPHPYWPPKSRSHHPPWQPALPNTCWSWGPSPAISSIVLTLTITLYLNHFLSTITLPLVILFPQFMSSLLVLPHATLACIDRLSSAAHWTLYLHQAWPLSLCGVSW